LFCLNKKKERKARSRKDAIYGFNKLLRIAASKECTIVVKAPVIRVSPNAEQKNQGEDDVKMAAANASSTSAEHEAKADPDSDEGELDEGGLETLELAGRGSDVGEGTPPGTIPNRIVIDIGNLEECISSAQKKFNTDTGEAIAEDMTVPLSKLDDVTISSDNVGKSPDLVKHFWHTDTTVANFRKWD
jgi:hypothetical protein